MRRWASLAALLLYGLGAGADFAYHLVDDLRTGDRRIEVSEIAVAFSAALFWPVDLVAMALLASREPAPTDHSPSISAISPAS
jgi:hypothetical protein